QMMTLHYTRGDLDDEGLSQVFFGEMMALPYSWVPAIRAALALFRLVRGETEAARGEFENLCAPGFEGLSRGEHWLVAMASLGNVAALLDDRRHGEQLYELLRPFAHLTVVHDQLRSTGGSVATVLGSLATMLGRFDDGAARYEQAIANETAMQAAPAVLGTKTRFARLLMLGGREVDQARAAGLIDEVETGARALGIRGRPFYLARLDELRRRTPRPRIRKR